MYLATVPEEWSNIWISGEQLRTIYMFQTEEEEPPRLPKPTGSCVAFQGYDVVESSDEHVLLRTAKREWFF